MAKCVCGHKESWHSGHGGCYKNAGTSVCACMEFRPAPRFLTVTITASGLTRSDYAKSITWDGYYLVIDWQNGSTDNIPVSKIENLLVTP